MTPVTRVDAPPGNVISTVKRVLWGHVGKDSRISREDLAFEVGGRLGVELDDRVIRKAIEELRQADPEGALIMSSSRLDGYWISNDSAELEAANAEDLSRIDAARQKIENRRKAITRHFSPQPTLLDVPEVRPFHD
jgi:hypothetical protein